MKNFWNVYWPITVMVALTCGLTGQFVWKMIYFPEPIVPVIIELVFFYSIVGIAIWGELTH